MHVDDPKEWAEAHQDAAQHLASPLVLEKIPIRRMLSTQPAEEPKVTARGYPETIHSYCAYFIMKKTSPSHMRR